ncbi:MAG: hypothetical protein QXS21_06945 [Thermoproteota archaeon]
MGIFQKIKEKVTPPKVNVSITLRKPFFTLGEPIEGTLQLFSQEEFDAVEIRCELNCTERVKRIRRFYDDNLKREVEREVWESANLFSARPSLSGPIHIQVGFAQSYQFKIQTPIGAQPSLKSVDRVVSWELKGVVAVTGRPDATSKVVEVQVALPSQAPLFSQPVIVKCEYCGTVYPETLIKCPNCGAPRKK